MRRAIVALGVVLIAVSPAVAQDDDWELTVRPEENLTIASVAYSGGNAIGIRCLSGQLQVLITGAPAVGTTFRPVAMRLSGIPREVQPWAVRSDGATLSNNEPARFARLLRGSPDLELALFDAADTEGEGPTVQTLRFELPPAHRSVDTVLTACGEAAQDSYDPLIRVSGKGVSWTKTPRLNFPEQALAQGVARGVVTLRCVVVASGPPAICAMLTETPPGVGFGQEALRAASTADFTAPPVEAGQARVIRFNMNFQLQ